ncbi:MAG: phosphohydrolase [Rickettsiales bacterium]|nr:phosphohydrolase [Rickettsiales bacterium]
MTESTELLLERILVEAKQFCRADGGTVYVRTKDDQLRFSILRNDSMNLAQGGSSGVDVSIPPLPLNDDKGKANLSNVATVAANLLISVNVDDVYQAEGYDFSGTRAFDKRAGYRTTSVLTIPLFNDRQRLIGVLQLINARNSEGTVVAFTLEAQRAVEALSRQAAIALDNQLLHQQQKLLLESFIKMIASSIDAKSPYTGGHCERVPILLEMLASRAAAQQEGPLAEFTLSEDEWYELRLAGWLHDCGKVITPVHVMDKATKLETIWDRVALVKTRVEVLKRDLLLEALRGGASFAEAERDTAAERGRLDEALAFIERVNQGGEFLPDEDKEHLAALAQLSYQEGGVERVLLDANELKNLSISRGTLTEEERVIINGHMVHTIQMLEALPFPAHLSRVPEYAGGHHERMDGRGYPRGLFAGDMSIPARMLAVADVFEALTAADRPYKKAKKLSEAMRIMGFMKKEHHLDPLIFDLFVRERVYLDYAQRFMEPEYIDEVDEDWLLDLHPEPIELPSEEERSQRGGGFLEEYRELLLDERS